MGHVRKQRHDNPVVGYTRRCSIDTRCLRIGILNVFFIIIVLRDPSLRENSMLSSKLVWGVTASSGGVSTPYTSLSVCVRA
jgi:hypothetical protein